MARDEVERWLVDVVFSLVLLVDVTLLIESMQSASKGADTMDEHQPASTSFRLS